MRPERRLLEADEVGCQWTQLEEELCLTVSIIIGLNSLCLACCAALVLSSDPQSRLLQSASLMKQQPGR